jgi:2,3-dihydroxybenzoate decarboxylase
MRYIALEEAFFIAELAELQPMSDTLRLMGSLGFATEHAERYQRRLTDFTEYRLFIGEHPDRFTGFAALPLQDPAAAAELERARSTGCAALSSTTA